MEWSTDYLWRLCTEYTDMHSNFVADIGPGERKWSSAESGQYLTNDDQTWNVGLTGVYTRDDGTTTEITTSCTVSGTPEAPEVEYRDAL
jgi:hypothetical protein